MMLPNILALANKYLFFSPVLTKNCKNVLCYRLGPSGSLFQDNIKTEWIYSNITNRDISVFLFTNNECDSQIYLNAGDICNKQLPFGIAKILITSRKPQDTCDISEDSYFSSLVRTELITHTYMPPSEGMQFFFHWQRQRKLWWKKISAFPGRFLLGEVTKTGESSHVNVLATFDWGNQVLERISISEIEGSPETDVTARWGKKSVLPMVIKSTLSLESAVLGLFSDALDEDSMHDTPVLRIHRKLSPYKCIFAVSSPDAATAEELKQLAYYLTKQFRKAGISTAYLPDCSKEELLSQFRRNDQWGIPYTIVLGDDSLKSGKVELRSRDTTLSEKIHVSDLSTYVYHLYKNF